MDSEKFYYLKYLKYKNKYLELLGGRSRSRSRSRSNSGSHFSHYLQPPYSSIGPIMNKPFIVSKLQPNGFPLMAPIPISSQQVSLPLPLGTGIPIVAINRKLNNSVDETVNNLTNKINELKLLLEKKSTITSLIEYPEFNGAFDILNKKFDDLIFKTIFDSRYNTLLKTYNDKTKIDILNEKNYVVSELKKYNLISDSSINSFENILMNVDRNRMKFFSEIARIYSLVKTFIVLSKLEILMV